LQAIRWRRLFFPTLKENMQSSDSGLIRVVGGIPIPEKLRDIPRFQDAFRRIHESGRWMHTFPEAHSWPYYENVRPFKKGMFTLARDLNIPVLPVAISWRPATGLFKLFKGRFPLVTVSIGEPIIPDPALRRKESVQDLRRRTHAQVCALAGVSDACGTSYKLWPAEGD
jgi:1-acyl-sn-glycerol-3-phosphate acyltransferase